MSFVATIPDCNMRTPAEVSDSIVESMQSCLVGVAMCHSTTEEYRHQVEKLHIHFSSALAICNAMRWDIAPHLRQVMAKSRNFWSAGFRDTINEDLKKEMENAIEELWDKCNDIYRIKIYTWADEDGNIHRHDSLHDYFLVDGEELILAKKDEPERIVQIRLLNRTGDTTEFGGSFHGFEHKEFNFIAYYEESDEINFLQFEDDTLFYRMSAPAGEHISSKPGGFA